MSEVPSYLPGVTYVPSSAWYPIGDDLEVWHNLGYTAPLNEVLEIARRPQRRVTDWPRALTRPRA